MHGITRKEAWSEHVAIVGMDDKRLAAAYLSQLYGHSGKNKVGISLIARTTGQIKRPQESSSQKYSSECKLHKTGSWSAANPEGSPNVGLLGSS